MIKTLVSVVVVISTSLFLSLSGIEGKWEGTFDSDQGPFTFQATYKVDGSSLSGTLSSDMGSLDFDGGTVDGDSFEYTFLFDVYEITHKGKLVGDKIMLTMESADFGDTDIEMTRVE